ncbi:MAG: SDR family NAD(P)-dependent oxidoreductase [Proteobacteria bacterium]|nr:SDR family NAD(P)-dependent oxidoreductase [Pseudomonadota bacterium]
MASLVSLVRNDSYAPDRLRAVIEHALELIGQPLTALIRPGDRVLVKPYLRHGSVRLPETRMVSHPAFVEAMLGLVRDSGGRPQLGDEGSRCPGKPQLHHEALWLHELAERFDTELVSFATSGGRVLQSGIPRPASYLLSTAVLDTDVVISLVNAQPHPSLVWSGALKNMFNAIIGAGNTQLSSLLPNAAELAGAVADVCRLARPTISVADMTTVCPGFKQALWRVGLIGASTDPVALDSTCLQALGWEPATIPSLTWGARLGVGEWQRESIVLRGLDWQDLPVITPACAAPSPEPPEPRLARAMRILNKTHLRPRPHIDRARCSDCTTCLQVCPLHAIGRDTAGRPRIDYRTCADCMVCADACHEKAIQLRPRGLRAVLEAPRTLARHLWRKGKAGHVWQIGGLAVRWHLERTHPVHPPRPLTRRDSKQEATTVNPFGKETDRQNGVALIVGAGPGLGSALARRFAQAGMDVAVIARNGRRLDALVAELDALGVTARAYACDITDDGAVSHMVRAVCGELGVPQLAVYNVEHFGPGHVVDIETAAFLECWRVNCLGAFLVGREVAKAMLTRGCGTLIFTGATAATRGRDGYANMAVGKWGQRALAQCMARELGPKGIHVAHVILDGGILKDTAPTFMQERMLGLFPDQIAENYLALHRQHPSTWTQELDLRPWLEKF